jgi:hypothetical protein
MSETLFPISFEWLKILALFPCRQFFVANYSFIDFWPDWICQLSEVKMSIMFANTRTPGASSGNLVEFKVAFNWLQHQFYDLGRTQFVGDRFKRG